MNEVSDVVVRTSRGRTIAGTRITLYTIMEHLKDAWPPHLIRAWFNLTAEQMAGVLAYIAEHEEAVEAEYEQVLREAAETEAYWRARNRDHLAAVRALPVRPGQEAIRAKLEARRKMWMNGR